MERLIENRLIYDAMFHVDQPHMVARYNQALSAFGLPQTARTAFVIDALGFSPEIASDLDDPYYLDPHGINQRFIILSPDQELLPVIKPNLSSTGDLVQTFYRQNAESLRLLTLKDVVFGEIEDSTYRVNTIEDLLSIRNVEFELHTGGSLLTQSKRLKTLIDRFYTLEDAWKNSELINEILELSRHVGDVRYNNITPRQTRFHLPSFWSSHFGGIYIFHDDQRAIVIGEQKNPDFIEANSDQLRYISQQDTDTVVEFLHSSGRIGKLEPKWLKRSNLAGKRFEIFIAGHIAAQEPERDLLAMDKRARKRWVMDNFDSFADDDVFDFLGKAQKLLMNNSLKKLESAQSRLKLMLLRADPRHGDAMLVNRLLSEHVPFDFLTRFFVNKYRFYQDYNSFSDNKRDYCVARISDAFKPDRNAFWKTIFEQPEE